MSDPKRQVPVERGLFPDGLWKNGVRNRNNVYNRSVFMMSSKL